MKIRLNGYLTQEKARILREALRGHKLEVVITLALVTGMRRDELLSLKRRDIDLERRELRFLDSKTKSNYRTIRLSEEMADLLKQYQLRQREVRLEAGIAWRDLGLVFLLGRDQLLSGFQAFLEQAGLQPLSFHELRAARWRALRERLRSAEEGRDGAQAEYLDLDKDTYPF
jgi:integrase